MEDKGSFINQTAQDQQIFCAADMMMTLNNLDIHHQTRYTG